jgi:alpha-amylase
MKKIFLIITLLLTSFLLISCVSETSPVITTIETEEPFESTPIDLSLVNPTNDIYYNLFVRSFADSDGDGIGDLNGITENLDYLVDLGITALWLLPIHPSPSYHGYNVIDYYDINPEYGTLEDYENLVSEASKVGIKIVLDLVINHTSDQHPWYISARNSVDSPYRNYYIWSGNTAYESFVGGMKDLNFNNEAVKDEIKLIMDFWLEKGTHGFRIDAARHLFEGSGADLKNTLLLFEFNDYMKQNYPNSFLVSEVFDYSYDYLRDYYIGSDSVFNFSAAKQIWDKIGIGSNRSALVSVIKRGYEEYRIIRPDFVDSPFIGNHDIDRIASRDGFNSFNSMEKLKLATRFLLTLPGSPFIYYGDELGMKGYRYEGVNIPNYGVVYDEYRRQPFIWGTPNHQTTWLPSDGSNLTTDSYLVQKADENSLFNAYKEMIQIRKENPALMYGNYFEAYKNNNSNIQGFIRHYEFEDIKQSLLVIHNNSLDVQTMNIEYLSIIYGSLNIEPFGTLILEIDSSLIEDYQ